MPICKQTSCLPSLVHVDQTRTRVTYDGQLVFHHIWFKQRTLERENKKWAKGLDWAFVCVCLLAVYAPIHEKWAKEWVYMYVCLDITSHIAFSWKRNEKKWGRGKRKRKSKMVNILWVKRVKWVTCIITSASLYCAWSERKWKPKPENRSLFTHSLMHTHMHPFIFFLRQWSHSFPLPKFYCVTKSLLSLLLFLPSAREFASFWVGLGHGRETGIRGVYAH